MSNKTTENAKNVIKAAAQKTPAKKDRSLKTVVESMLPAIERALPSVITKERFSRMILTALSSNPQLQECTPESFCASMMLSAQLGLEPNTPLGQAYLLPFKNRRGNNYVTECQFILGYRGMVDLAQRSGRIKNIEARTVYSKDEFSYQYGLHPDLIHVPFKGQDKGTPEYFYAVFHTIDDGFGFEVMSKEEVEAHAKRYSKSYNSKFSPWSTNFEAMAQKTVLKRVLKFAPLSTEINRVISADETIKTIPASPELIDEDTNLNIIDLPNEVSYEIEDEEPFSIYTHNEENTQKKGEDQQTLL